MSFLFKNYSLVKSFDGKSQSFDGSSDTCGSTVSVPTSENITNLETKLMSRFDELTKQWLNVKNVIIENLQAENEHLREKFCSLESIVTSLESNQNKLEQYGRRNNVEASGIPDSVKDRRKNYFCVYQCWCWHKIMTSRLVIELEKAKIVRFFLIESLPNKHFIIGKNWNQ